MIHALHQDCIAVVATAPVDKVSAQMQHLDYNGSGIAEVTLKERGMLSACQVHLWELLNDWYEARHSNKFAGVARHLSYPVDFPDEARRAVLELAAQVWARLEAGVC